MKSTDNVRLVQVFEHPQERVFKAWLSPKALSAFLLPAPGVKVIDALVDARVGGAFSLSMVAGEMTIPIRGSYQRIVPHSELAFTWLSPRTLDTSLVVLSFEALSETQTRLTLEHSGFPDAEARVDHEGGWGRILKSLDGVLGAA